MSGSRVSVLVVTTFFVISSSILLVACRRSKKFSTGVVAAGAACPAVVVRELPEDLIPAELSCFRRSATVTCSFAMSCREMRSWEWVAVQSAVRVLLLAV